VTKQAASLALLVVACSARTTDKPPTMERTSSTPRDASPPCANKEVSFTIAGERLCSSVPLVLGHGTRDDGRIEIGTDLLFDRGPSRTPRRYLDDYPGDRPLGVTLSPEFKTGDGHRYTLFFGIGGLRKSEWIAPLTKQVLPGALSYALAASPETVGAYVQMSRQKLDANGVATTSGTYFSKSGTVTFRTIDLQRARYAGRVELVFERTGPLAPDDGPDQVEVVGDFDVRH
jgi:hypothetical protein